jgi:hypothetical protein
MKNLVPKMEKQLKKSNGVKRKAKQCKKKATR